MCFLGGGRIELEERVPFECNKRILHQPHRTQWSKFFPLPDVISDLTWAACGQRVRKRFGEFCIKFSAKSTVL